MCSIFFLTNVAFAQSPQEISYQVVVHGAGGILVKNRLVGIQISILQESSSGIVVFSERHQATTNANALASIAIGKGTAVIGSLASIDWSTAIYFLQTQIDPTGGTNYTQTLVSQMLSVPYSLFAAKSDYNSVVNKPDLSPLASRVQFDSVYSKAKFMIADTANTVVDYDGYRYPVVKIGSQFWLGKNLRTTHLNDGTPIANLIDSSAWYSTASPAYVWPGNSVNFGKYEYGALYNYSAVTSNKLCPIGFHVPDSSDIALLASNFTIKTLAGLLDGSGKYWTSTLGFTAGANNSSKFSALPPVIRAQEFNAASPFKTDISNLTFWAKTTSGAAIWKGSSGALPLKVFVVPAFPVFSSKDGLAVRCIKN